MQREVVATEEAKAAKAAVSEQKQSAKAEARASIAAAKEKLLEDARARHLAKGLKRPTKSKKTSVILESSSADEDSSWKDGLVARAQTLGVFGTTLVATHLLLQNYMLM